MNTFDYFILFAFIFVPVFVSLFLAYKNKIIKVDEFRRDEPSLLNDYLYGNSKFNSLQISVSILATFLTINILFGVSSEVYENGFEIWISSIAFLISPLIGFSISGSFFLKLEIKSVFEYFELRFNSKFVRYLNLILYLLASLLSVAFSINVPGSTFNYLTELGEGWSIILIGCISTVCSTIGGIKTIVWNSIFNNIIILVSLLTIIIKGLYDIGGFINLIEITLYSERLKISNFKIDPFIRQSFWSHFFGSVFILSYFYSIDPQMIQRVIAAKDKKSFRQALIYHMPVVVFIFILICMSGLIIYANFFTCDLKSNKIISNNNDLLGFFIANSFKKYSGISGLFLASIFCATFNSVASILSSLSIIFWQHLCILKPELAEESNEAKSVKTIKALMTIFGIFSSIIAFIFNSLKIDFISLCILCSSLISPIFAVYILGSMFKFATTKGSLIASLFGILTSILLNIGSIFFKPVYENKTISLNYCDKNISNYEYYDYYLKEKIIKSNRLNFNLISDAKRATNLSSFSTIYSMSYMYKFCFGFMVTLFVGIIASLITRDTKDSIDDSLIRFDLGSFFKIDEVKEENENEEIELTDDEMERNLRAELTNNFLIA